MGFEDFLILSEPEFEEFIELPEYRIQ